MRFLKYLLVPVQIVYSIIISIRNFLYDFKILKTYKAVPVIISVGNIKNGGNNNEQKMPQKKNLIILFNLTIIY